jgi:hypothetical protein
MKGRFTASLALLVASGVALVAAYAVPPNSPSEKREGKQIVVRVHRGEKGLDYEMESAHLQKRHANFMLAELEVREGRNCQIIAIIDDNVDLGGITQISEMAINAGFKDIRPLVYWHKTGRMAQIQFGPAIKFSQDPEEIGKREKGK